MRIAFLVHSFPELSETFVLNQVTGLIDAGHAVDIYASGSEDGSTVHADIDRYRLLERTHYWHVPHSRLMRGIKAIGLIIGSHGWRRRKVLIRALDARVYGRQALSLTLLYASSALLSQQAYDIIHCQFGTLGWIGSTLRDIGAVTGKLVVSFRGADLSKRKGDRNYKEIFQKGDVFLPVCEKFRDRLIELGCDSRKIRVHHSGIKLSRFTYAERRRNGNEPTRMLTIGRLVEKKGIVYAIRAMARLKASGRRVIYTVAGDGPLRTELERMTHALGLSAEVRLVGAKSQEDMIPLLRDAHLLVAPSLTAESGDQEGIPNVLKEAMAMGMPVVSTQHSGIPELVVEGVSGLLVPEHDSDALVDGLAYLIDHPERWPAMGRAGRKRVEAEFDSDRLNEELVELYQQVVLDNIRASSGTFR